MIFERIFSQNDWILETKWKRNKFSMALTDIKEEFYRYFYIRFWHQISFALKSSHILTQIQSDWTETDS